MNASKLGTISCPEMYDDGTASHFAAIVADAMTLEGGPLFQSRYDRAYQAAHAIAAADAEDSPSPDEMVAAFRELATNVYAAACELEYHGGDLALDYARELVWAIDLVMPRLKLYMGL